MDDLFIVDTTGATGKKKSGYGEKLDDFDPRRLKGVTFPEDPKKKVKKFDPSKDFDIDDFESFMGWKKNVKPQSSIETPVPVSDFDAVWGGTDKKKITLPASNIKPGLEYHQIDVPVKLSRLEKKKEREKTAGSSWFNMRAPELTEEVKHDLEAIQMRSALDPKRFYKKNDAQGLPKYFQIGKVVDSPQDFYSSRLTNKERKKTIVDELMADAEFSKTNKRKFKEIIDEKQKLHHKAHRHAKRLKNRK